jgi:hypothetical protein
VFLTTLFLAFVVILTTRTSSFLHRVPPPEKMSRKPSTGPSWPDGHAKCAPTPSTGRCLRI